MVEDRKDRKVKTKKKKNKERDSILYISKSPYIIICTAQYNAILYYYANESVKNDKYKKSMYTRRNKQEKKNNNQKSNFAFY